MGRQRIKTEDPIALDSSHIKTIYNFTYRLSGNTKIAELLTQEAILMSPGKNKDDILLLKQAWSEFQKYYGCLEFKVEEPIQQSLLTLTPELRCILILRDVLGYSYERIVFILDKQEQEITRLIALGRREVMKKIAKQSF